MCGIKNFVSVRLYSAPQSHWTIVSILGICADGGVDQTEIDRHIQRSLLPPGQRRPGSLPGGRRSARQLCVIPDRRHQCAHRRMGRMRGHTLPLKYPGPGYPIPIPMAWSRAVWAIHLCRQSRPHRQCLILTWSDGPCGAKDFSTLALSPPPHDETAAEIFERLVAGNPRFKEAPKGQSLVIGGVRKPDADDVCDHRAERA